ncbi:MAG: tryptophan-rich sensory protein, partial [Cyanobacteria bacterium]|nr:tryptophan-rich sensory protein [Cyanobacteriota bacterium]MDW8203011.1 tryptophan-rich sensory protein [Cyanobacteriota bacterium SKYGB_h_bin112]
YIGLIAFGFYQLQTTQRQSPRLRRGGYWLVVASLAQCLWVYAFLLRQFSLSVVVMLGILLPLMGFYQRLGIGHERVSSRERWLIDIPIGVYLGWISVATVVNVAIALYSANWGGWGLPPTLWTVMMMVVSAAIAAIMLVQRHDLAFAGVIVWALVAIVVRSQGMPILMGAGSILAVGLLVGMLIIKNTTPSAQAVKDLDQ